ncbi:hypothetical protein SCLCIDRAFT_52028, partial [Scleroderma citrinum Foug A]
AANWLAEDTTTLLEFLLEELPKIGDGNFKRSTWTTAASLISTKHKITKGGGLKKQYEAVLNLKDTSGFTYSDKDGAGVTLARADTWTKFVKSHPLAKPFKTKGFVYFELIGSLTPKKGKGQFV